MSSDREYYPARFIATFFIASVIFWGVFIAADAVSYINYSQIKSKNTFIQSNLESLQTAKSQLNCSDPRPVVYSNDLDEVGKYISLLEQRFSRTDPRVVKEKVLYNKLQQTHFELVKALNSRCDSEFTTILFFYSNNPEYIEQSKSAGKLLDVVKNNAPEKIMVYSFDTSLDDPLVESLKAKFSISGVPIAIINEKDRIEPVTLRGLQSHIP